MLTNLKRIFLPHEKYKLAILYDNTALYSPSNLTAIVNFCDAALENGIEVEVIQLHDFYRLSEFDALFIRETTEIKSYTESFSLAAKRLGLVVLDKPDDIRRCTDKTIFHQICKEAKILTPKTIVIPTYHSIDWDYPVIIKSPYGSFSRDIYKCDNTSDIVNAFHHLNSLQAVIIQEFIPTEFDWRVIILAGRILSVCKYYMNDGDWRICKIDANKFTQGKHECIAIKDVPVAVMQLAYQLADQYGLGLYGIDIKEYKGEYYAIEVNDNPNIDSGVEDEKYPDIYDKIIKYFLDELKRKRPQD